MMKILVKKQMLYKVCKRLKMTKYWNYDPLISLLAWVFGAIIQDEWAWGNFMKRLFSGHFQGFYSSLLRPNFTMEKKIKGDLGTDLDFNQDYDPVFLYVNSRMASSYPDEADDNESREHITENLTSITTRRSFSSSNSLPYLITYSTKNCYDWLGWESK